MNHVRLPAQRLTAAGLLAAAFLLSSACHHGRGTYRHALGDAEAVLLAAPAAEQCCGAERASAAPQGGHEQGEPPKAPSTKADAAGDPYLLDVDPVTGKKLGPLGEQVVVVHAGRELRFASERNAAAFQADPAKHLPGVDQALIRQQMPFYALGTCPVTGEKLGSMGEPVSFVHGNRLVRFCCAACKPRFLKDPAAHLGKLDAAVIAEQGKAYPAKKCVVSGKALGGESGAPIDVVLGNRLVRLCGEDCTQKLREDPLKHLAKLDAAGKKGGREPRGKAVTYACPMHPDVVADGPGRCPKCGMDLVKAK